MAKITDINFDRIEWCCADSKITLDDLAAAIGVRPPTLTKEALANSGLSFVQLRKLAAYFGRGALFFLEAEPIDAERAHTPAFRTLANQKPEMSSKLRLLIERVERQREIYLSLREELKETDPIRFTPPDLDRSDLKTAAATARTWLKLEAINTFDSYRAAVEARGVLVFRSNGYAGQWQIAKETPVLGFALYSEVCPAIMVKKDTWDSVQSFTLMHELGHILLHKESSIDDEQDMRSYQGHEREANAFAGLLLVPDRILELIRDVDRPEEVSQFEQWLKPFTQRLGISTEVVLRRLLDAGRLSQEAYSGYRNWRDGRAKDESSGGIRLYRYREPKHIFGGAFIHTVLDSLQARNITLTKASRYLDGIKISDLHELEKHIANR